VCVGGDLLQGINQGFLILHEDFPLVWRHVHIIPANKRHFNLLDIEERTAEWWVGLLAGRGGG